MLSRRSSLLYPCSYPLAPGFYGREWTAGDGAYVQNGALNRARAQLLISGLKAQVLPGSPPLLTLSHRLLERRRWLDIAQV